jgi:hypothetical protein
MTDASLWDDDVTSLGNWHVPRKEHTRSSLCSPSLLQLFAMPRTQSRCFFPPLQCLAPSTAERDLRPSRWHLEVEDRSSTLGRALVRDAFLEAGILGLRVKTSCPAGACPDHQAAVDLEKLNALAERSDATKLLTDVLDRDVDPSFRLIQKAERGYEQVCVSGHGARAYSTTLAV